MESSQNKELVRSKKRAKKILSTADHVSNFTDHVFNYIPTLMPSNIRTCNNENFIEGAHKNILSPNSRGKEMQDTSQFTKLLSGEKDRVVLSNITNSPRKLSPQFNTAPQTGAEFHGSEFYENNKLLRGLRRAKKILSAANHITGHVPAEMPTNATDYNNENCLNVAFKDNCLDNNGKAMYDSSQFSTLLPQEKDKVALNDISNSAHNLATKFDAAVQTGNTCPPLKSINQGSNFDNHFVNDVIPSQNAFDNDDEFSEDENGDATNFCQFSNHDTDDISYSDLGNPDHMCPHCDAIFWYYERIRASQPSRTPVYTLCCSQGKVQLPFLSKPPDYLFGLMFDNDNALSKHFLENIRAYNMMFSFTSMGGKIDNSINDGSGRFVFRLSGQNHHRIGSLLPMEGKRPKFAQLYIYDTANEVHNRMTAMRTSQDDSYLHLNPIIVHNLKKMIDKNNRIAKIYRMARDRLEGQEVINLKLRLIRKRNKDSRMHNLPSVNEIAALVVGDVDIDNGERDIIVQTQSGQLQRIDELHPLYLPMQYPLLFPYGEDGYCDSTRHSEMSNPDSRKKGKLTMREFFAFRIQERISENAILLYSRRLFQQFVVDAYTMIEASRLSYIRSNQKQFRQDIYKGVCDAVFQGENEGCAIGKRIVLPSSFTGGARYMMQNYQDAMAICKWAGYPDIFITFTCNPKWPEITRYVNARGLRVEDRPDISVRIFKMKLKQLMEDLNSGQIFGPVKAVVYTIEFQKRGLPHCHILLFLYPNSKYPHPEDIDKIICAEIPDSTSNPMLYEAVKEFMIHGPCGVLNRKAPCMVDGLCSKFYPKQFTTYTNVNEDGYPVYKRRNNGLFIQKGGHRFDNRHIVPYNANLLLKYQSHINVEWCNQNRSIKYLFKYINKGNDRVTMALYQQSSSDNPNKEIDEIKCYYDCRYISPCEAVWRIFSFDINHRKPAVERLKFHLPGEQSVIFQDEDPLDDVLKRPSNKTSMFIAWMEANKIYPEAKCLTYIEFPSKFVYQSKLSTWQPRKRGKSIGRLIYVPPNAGELFYLGILLHRVRGPETYAQIRTINGHEYPSFRDACYKLGLLDDDKEFIDAIEEASLWATGHLLRQLFVTMLLSNSLTAPEVVWEKTWRYISEDLVYHQRKILQRIDIQFTDEQIKCLGLSEIDSCLRRNGKSLKDFPTMPQLDFHVYATLNNTLIAEQLHFDKAQLIDESLRLQSTMTNEQKEVFNTIISAVERNKGGFFFLDGYGGTGKTFLWRALTAHLRSKGQIVLCVASSGIAATLLPFGRTGHSRFAIPIAITEESTCNIKQGSLLADLVIKSSLIIWDEAPMVKKHCFEAMDRTFRDIMQKTNRELAHCPFGGKCVVLGGDFRQILPVIPGGTRSDIVFATIKSSYLWSCCQILTLTKNMRLQKDTTSDDVSELREFSEWMLKVGDGKLSEPNDGEAEIEIPQDLLLKDFTDPLQALFDTTYPDFEKHFSEPDYLKERAILAPTLDVVEEVNQFIMKKLPTEEKTYLSSDSVCNDAQQFDMSSHYITPSMLNDLKISGLPNHKLTLKIGIPIMLLRNLDQSTGLCNGTRLIVTHLGDHVIGATVISGGNLGQQLFLSRMNMCPSDSRLPFKLQRRQFPISISYCMTINKSQGQSLSNVTVYLPKPVFTHGQLYVAVSRVKNKKGLKFLIIDKDRCATSVTKNVVYKEIFENIV